MVGGGLMVAELELRNTDCCALDDAGAIGKGCPVVSYPSPLTIRPGAFK